MSPSDIPSVIIAIGAIGTTSFSLVDTFKVFGDYGPSALGYKYVRKVYTEMGPALAKALGEGWPEVLKGYWMNGTSRDRQVSVVMNALRLGLDKTTAEALALNGPIDPAALADVVTYLNDGAMGDEPKDTDQAAVRKALNALGRLDAYYRARLDAAFERADHTYRNGSRLLAGIVAVILSVVGGYMLPESKHSLALYIVVGVMAVPLAPIAKDLASAIKGVADNVKIISAKV